MTTPIHSNPTPNREVYTDTSVDTVPLAQPIPVAYPVPPNMDPMLLNSNGQPIPQYYFVHPNFYNTQQPIGQPIYAQQFVPQPQPVTIVEHKVVETTPAKEPETQIVVVEERKPKTKKDNSLTIVWVLFGLGFILPLLWWGGVGYTRSNQRAVRAGGVMCLIFAILSAIAAGIIVYLALH
jgi:hypothetical protein